MTAEFKKCPCGEVPEALHLCAVGEKYIFASPACCHVWDIRIDGTFDPADDMSKAVKAWNAAPRGES